jgi:hypothetical protein
MANRQYRTLWGTLTVFPVTLFAKLTNLTSGVPASTTAPGQGVNQVARGAAGRYAITLQDLYSAFLGIDAVIAVAGTGAYGASDAQNAFIVRDANATATATVNGVSKTVSQPTLQFLNGSGADLDVKNAADIYLQVTMQNSNVTR